MNAAAPVLHRSIASAAALKMAISALFVENELVTQKPSSGRNVTTPNHAPARHGWPAACHARTGTHPSCKLAAVEKGSGSQPVREAQARYEFSPRTGWLAATQIGRNLKS